MLKKYCFQGCFSFVQQLHAMYRVWETHTPEVRPPLLVRWVAEGSRTPSIGNTQRVYLGLGRSEANSPTFCLFGCIARQRRWVARFIALWGFQARRPHPSFYSSKGYHSGRQGLLALSVTRSGGEAIRTRPIHYLVLSLDLGPSPSALLGSCDSSLSA
jgi:hypothetical protein